MHFIIHNNWRPALVKQFIHLKWSIHYETYVLQRALLLIKIVHVLIVEHGLLICVSGSQKLGQQHNKMGVSNRNVIDWDSSETMCAVRVWPHMQNADSIKPDFKLI